MSKIVLFYKAIFRWFKLFIVFHSLDYRHDVRSYTVLCILLHLLLL